MEKKNERHLPVIAVAAMTDNQPFCAGVVWIKDGKMAVTLNTDHVPSELGEGTLRIGGVGGGQEPGETLEQCALREAREELGTERVALVSATRSYYHDMDTGELSSFQAEDELAPLLLERVTSWHPDKPYKPGLPCGPYLYCGTYCCEAQEVSNNPDDDVAGLLFVPLDKLALLEAESLTLGELLRAGTECLSQQPISPDTRLWMPANETVRTVRRLVDQNAVR